MSADKRQYIRWTPSEDAKLIELWPSELTDAQVAAELNRDPLQTRKRAVRIGLLSRRLLRHRARQGVSA